MPVKSFTTLLLNQCDQMSGKNSPNFFEKVAKTVAYSRNAKIFTSKLSLKVENINIKSFLKHKNIYNRLCFETSYVGKNVKIWFCEK
jgi:hypothetical protein